MIQDLVHIFDKPKIRLNDALLEIYDKVDARVALHDHMNVAKNIGHYFYAGASALAIIRLALGLIEGRPPQAILDFACGAGRVTRWLKAAFPDASIVGSDVRDADLEFQRSVLGVETWKSCENFEELKPDRSFDLVWVGSLLSHLPEPAALSAMSSFMSWLKPGGIAVVTFHGRRVQLGKAMRKAKYISDAKFARVEREYFERGFGYEEYENQKGLGFSLIKPNWFFEFAYPHVNWKVAGIFEAAWDHHHDVCVIANTPVCLPL